MSGYDYGLGLGAPFVGSFGVSSHAGIRNAPRTNQGRGSSRHYGTDYLTPRGTQAISSLDGVVVRVANDPKGYGKYVAIKDPKTGIVAQWAHMDSIDLKPGQVVKRGQAIGKTGNTGNSSGAHLDYTVTHNGVAIRKDGTRFAATGKSWLNGGSGGGDIPVAPTQYAEAPTPTQPAVQTATLPAVAAAVAPTDPLSTLAYNNQQVSQLGKLAEQYAPELNTASAFNPVAPTVEFVPIDNRTWATNYG